MASTVICAFNEFLSDKVNLDKNETNTARSSKNWLFERIHEFPSKDSTFPKLYSYIDISYGSFARRTKKRELDDIDIMIGISGEGSSYNELYDGIEISAPDTVINLKKLCNEGTNILNSRKVINKFISKLVDIPQYSKADMKLNKQAAVLDLTSYNWSFDIVPCFITKEDTNRKTYYLIPDGNGNWMKTDPRIDRDRVSDINQKNDGNVLNAIRIMKYWNKRSSAPTMPSYLIENIILNYYDTKNAKTSNFVDLELPSLFLHVYTAVYNFVNDPKGIQGDINNLSFDERCKISVRAYSDYLKSKEARDFEDQGELKASINKWTEIFGSDFPEFE
jgi:hypothetical protein